MLKRECEWESRHCALSTVMCYRGFTPFTPGAPEGFGSKGLPHLEHVSACWRDRMARTLRTDGCASIAVRPREDQGLRSWDGIGNWTGEAFLISRRLDPHPPTWTPPPPPTRKQKHVVVTTVTRWLQPRKRSRLASRLVSRLVLGLVLKSYIEATWRLVGLF